MSACMHVCVLVCACVCLCVLVCVCVCVCVCVFRIWKWTGTGTPPPKHPKHQGVFKILFRVYKIKAVYLTNTDIHSLPQHKYACYCMSRGRVRRLIGGGREQRERYIVS